MDELKYCKICNTRCLKICQVTRLAWVSLGCGLVLESPVNLCANWTYLRDLPSRRTPSYNHSFSGHAIYSLRVTRVLLAEFEKFVRIVLFPCTFSRF